MTLSVLLVEDSATDAKLVLQELRKIANPIDSERVETAEAMRAALTRRPWHVVLSDWSMPKFSALAALDIVKEQRLDIPFIIVSGTIGEETAVEAMRAGAHDYILKDKLMRLTPAVERELRECEQRAARRRAEQALNESETRFQRLASSGIIGICIADLNGRILDANETYLETLGFSHEELVRGAVSWRDLTPPELLYLYDRATQQLRESGSAPAWETECIRKDGSRVPLLVGVAMLEYPRCIAFTADLSARNEAERARVTAEEALRRSEEQLRQSQKMEAIGRLAGGVAHDFNNLLSVILSYGELIRDDLNPGDPLCADVKEICTAATRAAGLTRQLLLFSRQQVVEPKVLDLNDILIGMDKMLQRVLGEDVELTSSTNATGRVSADPSHIEQVILNLVVNARDAMPTGGKLTIETANVTLDENYALGHLPVKAGKYVMLAVSDTGIGMDKATQAKVFEPFFTTKEVGKGTGLGLSTVFGIVKQSGGTVWLYSEPDRGATFKIYLPQVDGELDSIRPLPAPATLRGSETVLLVEDEDQVRTIVASILKRFGYQVLSARDGGEALLICEQHEGKIDLLLSDVVMPRLSGPDLARRLVPSRPELKVLFMSGYADDSVTRHGVLESGAAYLQKPITAGSLSKKVREVLDGPR